MKHFIKLSLPLALVVGFTPPCIAVASLNPTLRLSLTNCIANLGVNLIGHKYCCPTGETKTTTTYTCPLGWTNDGGTCKRSSTSGTDAKGTYTATYGTCSPTTSTSTTKCYETSANAFTADGVACYAESGLS